MTMNRKAMIKAIKESTGCSQKSVEEILNCFLETLTTELSKGGSFTYIGFGSWSTRDSKERQGRKPSTGETITIPASRRVKFSAGKALKEAVNTCETADA